jgi:hypothetical protein
MIWKKLGDRGRDLEKLQCAKLQYETDLPMASVKEERSKKRDFSS